MDKINQYIPATPNLQSWKDSLAIQELLDVISQIIATEYVAIAKQNPTVFVTGG